MHELFGNKSYLNETINLKLYWLLLMHQLLFINCVKVPQKYTMLITGELDVG